MVPYNLVNKPMHQRGNFILCVHVLIQFLFLICIPVKDF